MELEEFGNGSSGTSTFFEGWSLTSPEAAAVLLLSGHQHPDEGPVHALTTADGLCFRDTEGHLPAG